LIYLRAYDHRSKFNSTVYTAKELKKFSILRSTLRIFFPINRFQLLDHGASLPIRNITSAEMKFLEKNNDSETIFQLETENMLTSRQEIGKFSLFL